MSLIDALFPGWNPDGERNEGVGMQGELVKRGKTWFWVQRYAGNTFMYECESIGHNVKVREGPGRLGVGFSEHARAVVYQKGVAVCEYSAHTPALNGLKRRWRKS